MEGRINRKVNPVAVLGGVSRFILIRHCFSVGVKGGYQFSVNAAQIFVVIGFNSVNAFSVKIGKADYGRCESLIGIVSFCVFLRIYGISGKLVVNSVLSDGVAGFLIHLGFYYIISVVGVFALVYKLPIIHSADFRHVSAYLLGVILVILGDTVCVQDNIPDGRTLG